MSMCWMVRSLYGCAIVRLHSACVILSHVSLVYAYGANCTMQYYELVGLSSLVLLHVLDRGNQYLAVRY